MSRHKRHIGYPEPGAWVWDATQSLPKIHPPEPLPDRQITPEELFEYIAYEGLGHCLFTIPPEKLQGLKLRKLWKIAQETSSDILRYLDEPPLSFREEPAGSQKKKHSVKKPIASNFGDDIS